MFHENLNPKYLPLISLREVLSDPNDYIISPPNFLGGAWVFPLMNLEGESKGSFKLDTILDFDFNEFNLFHLAQICQENKKTEDGIISLINTFFMILKKSSSLEQEKYLSQFFGETTYEDLCKIDPANAEKFIKLLFDDYSFTPKYVGETPAIVLQYADYIAHNLPTLPEELLRESDLSTREEESFYKKMPEATDSSQHGEQIEGYWKAPIPEIYDKTKKFFEDALESENKNEFLNQLKDLILAKVQPNEYRRYPIPNAEPWANQDKFLIVLKALEKISSTVNPKLLKMLLEQRGVSKDIIDNLLPLRLKGGKFRGPADPRLPLKVMHADQFIIQEPSGKYFGWTGSLGNYIEEYNIVPSEEFRRRINTVLANCRTIHLAAERELATYLEEHPLPSPSEEKTRYKP